jgi:hypothetical protein
MESQIKIFNTVRDLIIRHNLTKDELNSYFDAAQKNIKELGQLIQ